MGLRITFCRFRIRCRKCFILWKSKNIRELKNLSPWIFNLIKKQINKPIVIILIRPRENIHKFKSHSLDKQRQDSQLLLSLFISSLKIEIYLHFYFLYLSIFQKNVKLLFGLLKNRCFLCGSFANIPHILANNFDSRT